MRFGVNLPTFGDYGDAALLAELAAEAEAAGWDGFFVWDDIAWSEPLAMVDPWLALTAAALRTDRVRLGPLVTPLPRRRPWKVARETVTLDRLSRGRLVLGVGSGSGPDAFDNLGEERDPKVRAAMLDEALAVLAGLWTAAPFSFRGEHYAVDNARFLPPPAQAPRPPVWVGGTWPLRRPLRRAVRWDGYAPIKADLAPLTGDDVRAIVAAVAEERGDTAGFDVVVSGDSGTANRAETVAAVAAFAAAGATWWVEAPIPWQTPFAVVRERIRGGPPRA